MIMIPKMYLYVICYDNIHLIELKTAINSFGLMILLLIYFYGPRE